MRDAAVIEERRDDARKGWVSGQITGALFWKLEAGLEAEAAKTAAALAELPVNAAGIDTDSSA
jgi:hypothetical protein